MKTALITGANRGIGFATARQLAKENVNVLIGARDADKGEKAANQLKEEGHDAELLLLDVNSRSSVDSAAGQVKMRYGQLDILINNAGILPEATADPSNGLLNVPMFRQTFETNFFGAITVIQAFLPLLRESKAGRIVNVSSTVGSLADQSDPSSPYYDLMVPAYQTSKTALNGITVALSKHLKDTSIKVNSICPGFVQTDLTPQNRSQAPLTAEEAARPIVKMGLIPQDGHTGQFFDADGVVPW